MEDRESAKVTVTGEAVGIMDRLPLSAGGVRNGASVSLLSAMSHPMALFAAVALSHSTLSTGVSCQITEDSRTPGLGAAVRVGGGSQGAECEGTRVGGGGPQGLQQRRLAGVVKDEANGSVTGELAAGAGERVLRNAAAPTVGCGLNNKGPLG